MELSINITGLSFLFSSFVLAFLLYRFYQYWQRDKTIISKLFLYFVIFFNLQLLSTAIGSLLFAGNSEALKWVVISAVFFQGSACSVLGFQIFHLIKPLRNFSWLGFLAVFSIAVLAIIRTMLSSFNPHLESNRVINWDLDPAAENLRSLMFAITFLPMTIIFFREVKAAPNRDAKIKAIGLGLIYLAGLISGLLVFFLANYLKLGPTSDDIAIIFLSVLILILTVFTQRAPVKLVKKVYNE